jgi:hypothetical protein
VGDHLEGVPGVHTKRPIKIDDDVPVPPRYTYPLRELKVGQSCFVPGINITSLAGYAWNITRKSGQKFTMETRVEKRKKGVRCWRIA